MKDISNHVAYITGGTKGIGLGIAKALVDEGMRVAISGRSLTEVQRVVREIGTPNQVLAIESDVKDFAQEQAAIQTISNTFGQLDVVIANAGVGHFAPITDLSVQQWNDMIDTNLTGVFHTTKASVKALQESSGYLITIASLAGTNFFANGSGYNASKFGVVGFTQAVMLDVRELGIKTTTIMPGSVATYFNGHTPSKEDAWKIQPEDIGQMVVDILHMNDRTLPSKIEVRPSFPHKKSK